VAAPSSARLVATREIGPLQIEDWILAVWLAVGAPAVVLVQGRGGVFAPSRPIDGLFWLVGLCGAAVCLVSRSPDQPEPTRRLSTGIAPMAAFGMFAIGLGAAAALGVSPLVGLLPTIVAAGWMTVPPQALAGLPVTPSTPPGSLFVIPAGTRRVLLTPYLLTSGSILFALLAPLRGSADFIRELFRVVSAEAPGVVPALVLAAIPMVFAIATAYAVLVYFPRQMVDCGGGLLVWAVRFAVFLVGLIFGLGWLSVLGM
jgi:hypothetical protein